MPRLQRRFSFVHGASLRVPLKVPKVPSSPPSAVQRHWPPAEVVRAPGARQTRPPHAATSAAASPSAGAAAAAPVMRLLRNRKLPSLPIAGMMSSVPRIELRRSATGCSADRRRLMCVSMGGGPGLPPTRGVDSRGMAPAARATSVAQLRPSAKTQAKRDGEGARPFVNFLGILSGPRTPQGRQRTHARDRRR